MFSLLSRGILFCVTGESSVPAEENPPEVFDPWSASASMEPTGSKVIMGLFVVLVLIFVFAFLARRFLKFGAAGKSTGRMRVLETLPLGGKRMIQIIRVHERTLVVGVTGERIELLSELPEEDMDTLQEEKKDRKAAFGDILPFRIRKEKTQKAGGGGVES